jgi:hypothetical protein
MRLPLLLATATLLGGCSTVAGVRDAWNWDPTAAQAAVPVMAPEQAVELTNRLAELQIHRIDVRTRISAEPDIWARQGLYEELHEIGRELSPLERQLLAALPR